MDAAEAQKLLNGATSVSPTNSMSPVMAPLTTSAVSQAASQPSAQPSLIPDPMANIESMRQDYTAANQEGEIPLDIDSGVDAWTRAGMSFRRATEDKVAYLEKQYPGKVRLSHDGVPIVRVISSDTGKPKDIRAQELGMSASDFLDVVGQVPQIAAGVLAARYGAGGGAAEKGILPRIGNILAMAAGQEGAGAAQDVATRLADKQPVDLPEIVSERGKMAAGDVLAGGVIAAPGIATKVASKLVTPFAEQNAVTKQFKEAVKYFKSKGIELPMTPGESSGSQLLQRVEAMARQLPGSSTMFKDIVDKQNKAMEGIQKIAMGLPQDADASAIQALPSQEDVGKKAFSAIGRKNSEVEADAATSKAALENIGTKQIGSTIDSELGSGPVSPETVGKSIRDSATAKRAAFQAQSQSDYAKVYEHPQAKAYTFEGSGLADKAKALLKEMPAPETVTQVPSSITDKYGNEILRDETGSKIMRNFVPTGILPMLNDLAASSEGKFRLGDLLKMRTEVSNQIAQGEAVPGVQTHYLGEIRKALDSSIKEGLDSQPDKTLKNLWETANANYAKGVQPFQKTGIQELFRDPEQSGFLGNNQIVDRAINDSAKGQDTFNAYKEFLGASSPEFTALKRTVADKVLGGSMKSAGDTIDPIAFMRNLGTLSKNSPGVAREVFGSKSSQLVNIAKAMAAGDSGEFVLARPWEQKLSGVRLDPADVQAAAANGDLTSQKLLDLVAKEKAVGTQYRNKILKAIGSGDFAGDSMKPSDFVRYFSTQGEPSEVNQVLAQLHDRPDVIQDIRTKVAQDIFDRAYPQAQALDNPAMLSGEPRVLSQKGLQNALGDNTQRERYKSILGADTYRDIENLTKYLAPRGVGERAFSAAGGLSAGQQIAGLIRGGDLKYVDRTVKNWLMATAYTHPAIRAWAGNTVVPNINTAGITRYLISSTPVVEALYKDFGEKKAKDVMAEMDASIKRSQGETGNSGDRDKYQQMLDTPQQ